ncbi:hypothetical protein NIES4073_53240 [Kalymmatonema gypsitolerans NIES-4073]|nr:hypothetical protein NIES4073_53240 [Scytonema sp. NIES-4073]
MLPHPRQIESAGILISRPPSAPRQTVSKDPRGLPVTEGGKFSLGTSLLNIQFPFCPSSLDIQPRHRDFFMLSHNKGDILLAGQEKVGLTQSFTRITALII